MDEEEGYRMGKKLVMYDVRGIQDYIFRTPKIKDAIGASAIVENIIMDALRYAVGKMNLPQESYSLEWFDGQGPIPFEPNQMDVRVLYIGGGNAYALISEKFCQEIHKNMSKYIMEESYSLQLAVAMVSVTDDYSKDYGNLQDEMQKVKANMPLSTPIGALPIMQVDVKTGYAITDRENGDSTESSLKRRKTQEIRKNNGHEKKGEADKQHREADSTEKRETGRQSRKVDYAKYILDNYITEKEEDSILAVVHIDGNNMGMRIRRLFQDKTDYTEAINEMRKISYYINDSYQSTYEEMEETFNNYNYTQDTKFQNKGNGYFIMKVLVAGDDITYICNAQIALATVDYFCKHLSGRTMTGQTDEESIQNYGFSACAGVALFQSHFPFYTAYFVAEECCSSAKDRAKEDAYKEKLPNGELRIGNWIDFQICKNVQAKDLSGIRRKEYLTCSGESLLLRPYHIKVAHDIHPEKEIPEVFEYDNFRESIRYFLDEEKMPRSFAKSLRNSYSQGREQVFLLQQFLHSRNWLMPRHIDGDGEESYLSVCPVNYKDKIWTALWYDALEMLDYWADIQCE